MRPAIVPLLAAALVAACGPHTMPEAPRPVLAASRSLPMCVVRNGELAQVATWIDPATGDTMTVDGQRFSLAARTGEYAGGADWYQRNEVIIFRGFRFIKYGIPRQRSATDVAHIGEYRGVPVFAEAGATGTPEIIYIPDGPGCSFQTYTGPHAME